MQLMNRSFKEQYRLDNRGYSLVLGDRSLETEMTRLDRNWLVGIAAWFLFPKQSNSGRKMRKWIGLLKSICLSFVIYMWFLGSSLLVQIDSSHRTGFNELSTTLDREVNRLRENMHLYCKEKMHTLMIVQSKGNISSSEEKSAGQIMKQARREKTIRDNLIYIPELKQLWCLVPKAASTSWSHKILEAIQDIPPKFQRDLQNVSIPIQVLLRKYYGNLGSKKYQDVISSENVQRIALARHPLTRIISAFEDKLKDRKAKADSMFFYGHYGVKIKKTFRKNKRLNKRKEPTFEEFLDYLIETDPDTYDEHWKPISLLCGPCRVNYNYVIRQEDLYDGSSEYHLLKLGFKTQSNRKQVLRKENESKKTFKTFPTYFKNVTSEKKQQILKIYEDDFRLFGYHTDDL